MCERVEASVFLGQHLQDIKDSVILLDRAASVRCFNWIQMCTEPDPLGLEHLPHRVEVLLLRRIPRAQVAQVPVPGREPSLVRVVAVLALAQVSVSERGRAGRGDAIVGQSLLHRGGRGQVSPGGSVPRVQAHGLHVALSDSEGVIPVREEAMSGGESSACGDPRRVVMMLSTLKPCAGAWPWCWWCSGPSMLRDRVEGTLCGLPEDMLLLLSGLSIFATVLRAGDAACGGVEVPFSVFMSWIRTG
ncbi:hypothetical protein F7725_028083 [Dissostichus mawsoni]|uniref:Uncharacterized protein n=1 Tax=Dissostichus mawsoni TaxID=36200 RepID=A0A7J5XEP1_DISMA|nr:hypothetical protein F7725_028083 [Dissostichus mawsoni]